MNQLKINSVNIINVIMGISHIHTHTYTYTQHKNK